MASKVKESDPLEKILPPHLGHSGKALIKCGIILLLDSQFGSDQTNCLKSVLILISSF